MPITLYIKGTPADAYSAAKRHGICIGRVSETTADDQITAETLAANMSQVLDWFCEPVDRPDWELQPGDLLWYNG